MINLSNSIYGLAVAIVGKLPTCGSTAALTFLVAMIFAPSAYSQSALGVVILLYPPTDCETDFNADFWAKYDSAMAQEWGIASQTMCLEGLSASEKIDLVSSLQDAGINVITMVVDNAMLPDVPGVQGLARPHSNFGTVNFNYDETTKTVSHETLHLVLEERGTKKAVMLTQCMKTLTDLPDTMTMS